MYVCGCMCVCVFLFFILSSSKKKKKKKKHSMVRSNSPLFSKNQTFIQPKEKLACWISSLLSTRYPPSSFSLGNASILPRNSSIDDGRHELKSRGIYLKEIKSTMKPLVISDQERYPMPQVKLERPRFARINY
ncbi:hypothetical protein BY458DRAFT_50554 [Sporodiniella umbellata]|nr:hypothetical protein BY458DRAFT_50554 [Sporodiniella umbellata]